MNSVFVDTSFLIALVLSDDSLHERALDWHGPIVGNFVATEFVLLEFADALSRPSHRDLAHDCSIRLRTSNEFRIVSASSELLEDGIAFYARHLDKWWTLTDCLSFVVMKREGIQEALSHDQRFEQAGFRALLRHLPGGGAS